MPFRFEFDAAHGLLAARLSGKLSDDVLLTFSRNVAFVIERYDVRAGIFDFTEVTDVDLSTTIVQRLATMLPTLPGSTPRAIVAPNDLLFGLSRMLKSLSAEKRQGLQIVRTERAALDYLGIRGELQFVTLASPDALT